VVSPSSLMPTKPAKQTQLDSSLSLSLALSLSLFTKPISVCQSFSLHRTKKTLQQFQNSRQIKSDFSFPFLQYSH
jgi:hypothetical protein